MSLPSIQIDEADKKSLIDFLASNERYMVEWKNLPAIFEIPVSLAQKTAADAYIEEGRQIFSRIKMTLEHNGSIEAADVKSLDQWVKNKEASEVISNYANQYLSILHSPEAKTKPHLTINISNEPGNYENPAKNTAEIGMLMNVTALILLMNIKKKNPLLSKEMEKNGGALAAGY